jgi:nucleoside phosphorylase
VARSARSAEVARIIGVSPATIQRYARESLIPYTTTAGGHRRFDVEEVREALKRSQPTAIAQSPGRRTCKAVILTALGLEMTAVLRHLPGSASRRLRGGTRYEVGEFTGTAIDWTIYAAEIGEGNMGAAAEATAAILELSPDLVLFVGVAGSLKPDLVHGSVVVASRVYSYLSGKAGEAFWSRPVVFPTWHSLEQIVRTVRRSRWTDVEPQPIVELKPIAAGDRVVASTASDDFQLLIERYNDAAAIDMESAGVYAAAARAERVAALAIRGISDMVADKRPDADARWQPVAAANAAAFAFAILSAVDPLDLPLGPSPAPYPSERSELLGSVPPPAAAALERAMKREPRAAFELLRIMAEPGRSASRVLSDINSLSSPLRESTDADLWAAAGEFAVAHNDHLRGAEALQTAAKLSGQGGERWGARAALAFAARGELSRAEDQLKEARAVTTGPTPFLDLIEAVIAEDADRIIEAARRQESTDPIVDLMHVQALQVKGRIDDAIDLARASLARAPSRAMTGGLALATARMLIQRAEEGAASSIAARDLFEAVELALLVRDLRRSWGGPSAEAAYVAAVAAFDGGDLETALRVTLAEPDGSATAGEAADPELIKVGANTAMALRRFDLARAMAALIKDPLNKLLVEVDCDIAEGKAGDATAAALSEAIPLMPAGARFRAYLQLAEIGFSPLPDLALLEDPEASEIVVAEAELRRGNVDDAIRRLRALTSQRGRAFLINAYLNAKKVPEAVDALRDGAKRFGEPRYLLRAATMLAASGELERAKSEAMHALTLVPGRSHVGQELRLFLIEVSSRLRDWEAVLAHAEAAIADGNDSPEVRWAIVWSEFSRRDPHAALRAWRSQTLRPRNEDEVILITQLLRVAAPEERVVIELLDLAEEFQGSEHVSAAAFAALFEVSRELKLPNDVVERLHSLTASFFERWPESTVLRRIDASDMNTVVEYLRETLSPSAKQQEEVAQKVQLGDFPYGMLAASVGRSLAEALVKNAAGGIAAGQPDPHLAAREDRAAASAGDKAVVADTSALVVVARTGLDPRSLIAAFSTVHVPSVLLDDAFIAADALRLRSTSTMGWDPRQDRPVLTEVEPELADQWAQEAEGLLDRIRGCQITEVRTVNSRRDLAIELMLSPVRLAQELGTPLWSDDRAMRSLARNEGVESFGTVSILRTWTAAGRLADSQVDEALLALLRQAVVDFDLSVDAVTRLAAEEEWRGGRAAFVLSRPSFWIQPEPGLAVYKMALAEAAAKDPTTVSQWAFAAALGAARLRAAPQQGDVVAGLFLIGFLALGLAPEPLPHLLSGARAAADLLGSGDPLVPASRMLAASLREQFGEEVTGTLFTRAISDLTPEDRAAAFGAFLQHA